MLHETINDGLSFVTMIISADFPAAGKCMPGGRLCARIVLMAIVIGSCAGWGWVCYKITTKKKG